jgi:hypothetical protein
VESFWIPTASNLVATIVGGLLVALIPIGTRPNLWHQVNQVTTVQGDLHQHVDNSRLVVETNISQSRKSSSDQKPSGDDPIWVAVVACLIATGLFLTYHLILLSLTVGIALGLLATLVMAVRRTARFRLWDGAGILLVIEVALSLGAAALAWVGVANLSWHGTTIGQLSDRVNAAAAANQPTPGIIGTVVDTVLDPALQLIKLGFQDQTLFLALTLMAAVLLSSLMLIWSWLGLFDWMAYLGFVYGQTTKKRLVKRAIRFENRSWGGFWAHVALCAIVALFATGLFLSFIDGLMSQGLISP